MLISLKLDADFSRGCAGSKIGNSLFATHPRPSIRELLWEIRSSWLIGLGLCTIADMDFREYTFDVAWSISLLSMRRTPPGGIMLMVSAQLRKASRQGRGVNSCVGRRENTKLWFADSMRRPGIRATWLPWTSSWRLTT